MPNRKLGGIYDLQERPRLVQRVQWNDPPNEYRDGIDHYFSLDYMGSAEFEFGTCPGALRFMREDASGWDKKLPIQIKAGKFVAWYVGPLECLEYAEKFFSDQLDKEKRYDPRLQERTEIFDSYTPLNKSNTQWYNKIIGWWALDAAPCPWAFFKKKEYAKKWLECILAPKPEVAP